LANYQQLLINGITKSPVKNVQYAEIWMKDLLSLIENQVIIGPICYYLEKDNRRGLVCICATETSHITLHIWDEPFPCKIQFDFYTCDELPLNKIVENLESKLGLYNYNYLIIEREEEFKIKIESKGD